MISKAQIKLIRSLQQKKYRKINGLFIAEGTKIATELLTGSRLKVEKLYATSQWLSKQVQIYASLGKQQAEVATEKELEQMSALKTAQEVLMVVSIPTYDSQVAMDTSKLYIAAEGIRDPGNMGTIIRLADWYGVEKVFCSEDCADAYNPKTVQATMGSIGRVEVREADISELIGSAGMVSYAAVLNGADVHGLASFSGGILMIGNESTGLSERSASNATHSIGIPRFGHAESLNAALATGILLDNLRRIEGRSK